jgi:hypothetical protein
MKSESEDSKTLFKVARLDIARVGYKNKTCLWQELSLKNQK